MRYTCSGTPSTALAVIRSIPAWYTQCVSWLLNHCQQSIFEFLSGGFFSVEKTPSSNRPRAERPDATNN